MASGRHRGHPLHRWRKAPEGRRLITTPSTRFDNISPGSVYYQWDFDDGAQGWSGAYASGATAQGTHAWAAPGEYDVRARAKDGPGSVSAWSRALAVTIVHLGDMNLDGAVNFVDITPFSTALTNPTAYEAQYNFDPDVNGDINQDGVLNFADITPFVNLLSK
ncbi:MAG TPA: PKD domain-containing protein [Phycisphaerae bacterium]|nr:PKD domain-containing protein [Phycisphaerae bacterium]HQL53409.1 PKD domain-containing protein [Phycisphaerae bacterium]